MANVLRVLIVVLLGVAISAAALWANRVGFIYSFIPTGAPPADIPRTEVRFLPAHNGAPALEIWVTTPEPGQPVIAYFMGEAGTLSVYEPRLRALAEAGFGIAAMAYRGGGGQEGEPSEATLMHDARRVYAGLDTIFGEPLKDTRRIIYGYSLGAGIAAQLAAEHEELLVVLESPFLRFCDVNLGLAAIVPGCFLMQGHEFEIRSHITEVDAPLLILHGENDDVTPIAQGRALFDAAVEPKFFRSYPDGNHENLWRVGATDDAIAFIRVLTGQR